MSAKDREELIRIAQALPRGVWYPGDDAFVFSLSVRDPLIYADEDVVVLTERLPDGGGMLHWKGRGVDGFSKGVRAILGPLQRSGLESVIVRAVREAGEDWRDYYTAISDLGFSVRYVFLDYRMNPLIRKVPDLAGIRMATAEDARTLEGISAKELGEWARQTEDEFLSLLADGKALVLCKENSGQLAGFITVRLTGEKPYTLFVRSLAVSRNFRGRGWGRQLTEAALDWAAHNGAGSSTLWVERFNQEAICLYRSLGFRPSGKEEAHFIVSLVPG
ncbi:MAG: GNAT family N-acetyltransferase [Bacillota bacterium]